MNKHIPKDFRVPGFLAAGISAGIKKKKGERDLALLHSEGPARAAGVFTTNRVKAAPVLLSMERIRTGSARSVLINSGCANACTGNQGVAQARRLSARLASSLHLAPARILLASTGVIGQPLPLPKIEKKLPALIASLSRQGLGEAAQAIMTTDTFPKAALLKERVNGRKITLAGMAKGAGMIAPHMATLLCFVLTDALVSRRALRLALREATNASLNRITVDGDMSTNDTLLILANGRAENAEIFPSTPGYRKFTSLLQELLTDLAKMIVRDGEGATKLVRIQIEGARTTGEAEKVARAVANSPLVKTAFFGEDANWGRILCAAGYSGAPIVPEKVNIFFDDVPIVHQGLGTGPGRERRATAIMKKKEFTVRIQLNRGSYGSSLYTCDFSYDYVRINAAYRS
jgi:glutamate N-acetyltransferase/amino-acid N-acetyltransferase